MLTRGLVLSCFALGLWAQSPPSPPSTSSQALVLDDAQKARCAQEARRVTQALGEACQRLDIDAALKDWLDDGTSLAVAAEGYLVEPKALREGLRAFYASLASLRFTTLRDEVRVLAPDLVLQCWCYQVEGTTRSGTPFTVETETATFLLRKRGGAWKIIFFQESAAPAKR